MIGVPFLFLGALLVLAAIAGPRVQERRTGLVGAIVLSPLHPASWQALLAILLGFWVELFAFMLAMAAFSAGTSLLIVGVGIVIIGLAVEGCRLVVRVERWRMTLADPRPLLPHAYRPYGRTATDLFRAVFLDLPRWRDVLYVVIAFPLAMLEFVFAVGLWAGAFVLLAVPFSDAAITGSAPATSTGNWPAMLVALVAGIVLLPVAASVSRGLVALHRAVVAGLVCDSETTRLQRRVETLEGSRRAVLDVEASELRRIERDLHDGAQQRLVRLTMDLGLAADRIEADPAAARELVLEAQGQARQALAELRDLVRGISPAILLDRGLVPALSSLAARSPVPTTVQSTLPEGVRPPDSVERAAYFVVAEALANVAKHATATRCEIRCRPAWNTLVVEVWDDGAGGATMVPGGGLAGLAGRVEALDGTLAIDSPAGGPTTVRAEIPVVAGVRIAAPAAPAATPADTAGPVATAGLEPAPPEPGQEPR